MKVEGAEVFLIVLLLFPELSLMRIIKPRTLSEGPKPYSLPVMGPNTS